MEELLDLDAIAHTNSIEMEDLSDIINTIHLDDRNTYELFYSLIKNTKKLALLYIAATMHDFVTKEMRNLNPNPANLVDLSACLKACYDRHIELMKN